MGKSIYIMSDGTLRRKDNTVVLEGEERTHIPVQTIDELMVFGEVTLNKRFLEFATAEEIIIHFFNHHGYYQGTYYPREHYNSGSLILQQVAHYLDETKRLVLARQFVLGAIANLDRVLAYYENRGIDLAGIRQRITEYRGKAERTDEVSALRGYEGMARQAYYGAFDSIVGDDDFALGKRTRRPPTNRMNALISFGNSLCYVLALSQLYRTHLDPRVGYLHETNFRRFTLNLDLAEVFKPILVDRVILSLVNKRVIQARDFASEAGGIYLTERGRSTFLRAWEERLQSTIRHRQLRREVSYRHLVRLEAHKLEKHLLGDEAYKPFTAWW